MFHVKQSLSVCLTHRAVIAADGSLRFIQRMEENQGGDGKSQNCNDQCKGQPAVGKAELCDLLLRLNFLFLF